MMLSFIHSSFIKGAGIFAGGRVVLNFTIISQTYVQFMFYSTAPFPTGLIATTQPFNVFDVTSYYPVIDKLVDAELIDSTGNLASNWGQFIYRGIYDYTPAREEDFLKCTKITENEVRDM